MLSIPKLQVASWHSRTILRVLAKLTETLTQLDLAGYALDDRFASFAVAMSKER